jgi:MoaA/NifB/PqqE/SkfB family radical SAM enzyme
MDDLRDFGVPVLILSGGEPLLRPKIFEISRRAKALGFFVGLSSNGTLIDERTADRIAEIGYGYVGISLDGVGAVHDAFRRRAGAFEASLEGIRRCRDRGLKVGVHFTLTLDNEAELPGLLRLIDAEDIDKFYLSHLNYAGRGNKNRGADAAHETTRRAMDLLFETCWNHLQRDRSTEFVTGNNDADGVYLLRWARERHPDRVAHCAQSWRNGAVIRRGSTSPTLTIWATSTRIPSGGTIPSATCASGRSRRSGRTSPTR